MARRGGRRGSRAARTNPAGSRIGLKQLLISTVITAVVGAVVAVVISKETLDGVVDQAGGGPHLVYTFERHLPTTPVDDAWALPTELAGTGQDLPKAGPDFHRWVIAQGGVQISSFVARIELTNPRGQQVRINSIRGRILASEPAWDGTRFCEYSQGSGEVTIVEINLGDQDPVARVPDNKGTGSSYFLTNGDITLAKDETHSLVVKALPPPGKHVSWNLEVRYTVDGVPTTMTIDDKGAPFTVTDWAEGYGAYFVRAGKETVKHKWAREDGWYERYPGCV